MRRSRFFGMNESQQTQPPWTKKAVSFEEFMEFCLYHPVHGYYRRPDRPVFGKEGDYFTSPGTHRIFGEVLSRALASYLAEVDRGGTLDLIELGAADGRLGRLVMGSLVSDAPELAARVRYQPIEVDRPRLPPRIEGVVFSNEFFDALPVRRVRIRGGRPQEIFVSRREEKIREVERDPTEPRILDYLRRGFPGLHEGWTYEANLRMLDTVSKLDRSLDRGVVLTIDYGYRRSEYGVRPRPEGTLQCYRRHQAHPDPYRFIGRQDMTAHVNFDMLLQAGAECGWESEPIVTQREFLMRWGLTDRLLEEERRGLFRGDRLEERLNLKRLLMPDGISDTMKVVVQRVRLGS